MWQRLLGILLIVIALAGVATWVYFGSTDNTPSELLEELRALSIRLVLLSNTSVTHLNFIRERFEVLEYFDDLTTSFAAGALKPDSAIYEHALGRADAAPSECFFTDDIEAYVVAARTFGIHAEVYTETSLTRRQLRSLGVEISE